MEQFEDFGLQMVYTVVLTSTLKFVSIKREKSFFNFWPFNDLKHLHKRLCASSSQIIYRAYRGGAKENVSKPSTSHEQYGSHVYI